MRDLVILALLVGAAFFGARQCGCFQEEDAGEPPTAEAATAAAPAGSMAPVAAAKTARAEPVPTGGGARVAQEAARVASGAAPEDPAALARIAGGDGPAAGLAAAVLEASAAEPMRRWLGLTALCETAELSQEERSALVQRTAQAGREALATPERSVAYRVVPGDALVKICNRLREGEDLRVSPGLLRWLNGLRGDMIYPGQMLRAPREPVRLWASKALFLLRVYVGPGLIAEYPIGLGKDDRTPTGTFTIDSTLEKAPWRDPETGIVRHYGEDGYAIGTRWLGFAPEGPHVGLGIHGTNEPETIGQAKSLGCVRMRNSDVESLFELVPRGTQVEIVDRRPERAPR